MAGALLWGMWPAPGTTWAQAETYATADSVFVDTLEVLVLLPFGLQVDTLPGGFLPRKEMRLREIAMESLHGVESAARELAAAGVPIKLNVVDEMPDSSASCRSATSTSPDATWFSGR